MNFIRKLFGSKSAPANTHSDAASSSPGAAPKSAAAGSAEGADPIRVHDAYGREHQMTKEQWRDKVLLPHLEKARARPEELSGLIAQALRDGFAAEVLPFAAHLAATDPEAERGHVLHAAALLDLNQHAEAERLLSAFIAKHGETALSLANLAKARAGLGDKTAAVDTLWRALSLDPNQEAAVGWYAAHHGEKDGPAAALEAFRRVAELPDSWRARLWLARHALEQRQLPAALKLYDEAIERAPRPVPADLLQQMSGDLGNHAHLPELLQLTAPYYDIAKHGLPTGNNLLKAYHDLGQLEAARRLLDRLYAQNAPTGNRRSPSGTPNSRRLVSPSTTPPSRPPAFAPVRPAPSPPRPPPLPSPRRRKSRSPCLQSKARPGSRPNRPPPSSSPPRPTTPRSSPSWAPAPRSRPRPPPPPPTTPRHAPTRNSPTPPAASPAPSRSTSPSRSSCKRPPSAARSSPGS